MTKLFLKAHQSQKPLRKAKDKTAEQNNKYWQIFSDNLKKWIVENSYRVTLQVNQAIQLEFLSALY